MATTKTTATTRKPRAAKAAAQATMPPSQYLCPPAPVAAPQGATLYAVAKVPGAKQTKQRKAAGLGMAWHGTAVVGNSIRHLAISTIVAQCPESFTQAQAVAALQTIAAQLGCSSPATRFSKLVRSKHIVPAQQ